MDALRGLLIEHDVDAGRIREVRLGTASNVLNALRYAEPENALQAKFSIQFMLGVLALRRRAGIAEFRDEVVLEPEVRAMMAQVRPYLDEEIEARGFERIRSRVEVELDDGSVLEREATVSRGTPEWPMTREDLAEKFTDCATGVLADSAIAGAIATAWGVEELGSVSALLDAVVE